MKEKQFHMQKMKIIFFLLQNLLKIKKVEFVYYFIVELMGMEM